MDVVVFQTADAFRYDDMLRVTSRTVIEFCRRSGCSYESFTGLKRGFWPWQATYNRIVQFNELLARGWAGWAIYLDADAYVADLDFDIVGYLADKSDNCAVLAPSMSTDHVWDVNAGVCFINLGHDYGRALIAEWFHRFSRISDARLREARVWMESDDDQDLLQQILREHPLILQTVHRQSTDLINSDSARFIRQHLRQYTPDLAFRIRQITSHVDRILNPLLGHNREQTGETIADAEALDIIDAVYLGLLGRRAEHEARQNALAGVRRTGIPQSVQRISGEIASSQEFRSRHGAVGHADLPV